ncbi:hypothetical protein [Massilia consociata]|uniref:Uncharacterized protein n=1 Tax=Massilia consociata TaxID=760117 RepID=A0ABV6FJG4_9BURK
MKTKKILIAALLACAFTPALAEEMGFEDAPRLEPRIERRIVTRTGGDMQAQAGGMAGLHGLHGLEALGGDGTVIHLGQGRLVKNAPYSAEMVTERSQTLADGNQIVNKTSAMSYRDSAGRTRTEVRSADGEVRSVTIHDPVEGARYVLRPRDKTAIKIAAPNATALAAREHARAQAAEARVAGAEARLAAQQAREQARAKIEELRKEGKLPEGVHERMIVKQVERSGHGEHKDVQIRIAQVAPGLAASRIGPVLAGAIGEHKWAAKAETKDLGTREFNGVKATGTQRSYEIPAGEIGNRNPIVVSTETWTSPELGVVYQKRSDPRAGDTVFRLEGLKREEPAAALFAVPADYTVKDPVSVARSRIEKKGQ